MATTSVTENSRIMRPATPPMNSTGMKAATRDTLIEMTVKPICRAPTSEACIGAMPASMLRWTFSIMTMASSTTKPTAMANAMSVRLLTEKPSAHIAAQVPASDNGTVTPAARVGVMRRRNTKTTIMTRAMASRSVNCMSCTLARMVVVRSVST